MTKNTVKETSRILEPMKVCSRCGSTENGFYADKRASDGLQSQCKPCMLERQKKRRQDAPGAARAAWAAAYQANKESIKQRVRAYYAANRDAVKRRVSEYCKTNAEAISVRRRLSRLDRLDACLMREREQYRRNPLPYKARAAARRERSGPGFSAADVRRMLRQQRGRCAACREVLGERYEVDHVMPLALGGENGPRNLQLLCRSCNREKHCKHPIDFMRRKGYLL